MENKLMSIDSILGNVENYYNDKLKTHGATPKGVDWNSTETQFMRFKQLMQICDLNQPFTLMDYGCGYGALLGYLKEEKISCSYLGFDISELMVNKARELYKGVEDCSFVSCEMDLPAADYVVASGLFNVKMQTRPDAWKEYMHHIVNKMDALSERGFAFNALTSYSDEDRKRPDLYYSDPLFWFDYSKRHFSRYVSVLHDYPLYEFTILVRKK
jgi:SAM-dependent methyltransferase